MKAVSGEPYTDEQMKAIKEQERKEFGERYAREQADKASWLTAEKVSQTARNMNAWIFNPEDKEWYTPDEFEAKYRKFYKNHPLFHKVKIMNPMEGVEAGFKQITKIQGKLLAFYQKVINYYSGK